MGTVYFSLGVMLCAYMILSKCLSGEAPSIETVVADLQVAFFSVLGFLWLLSHHNERSQEVPFSLIIMCFRGLLYLPLKYSLDNNYPFHCKQLLLGRQLLKLFFINCLLTSYLKWQRLCLNW